MRIGVVEGGLALAADTQSAALSDAVQQGAGDPANVSSPSLYVLGLNHRTAPLHVRERVVFHVERLRDALRELARHRLVEEAAILSTCNRTELYVCGARRGGAEGFAAPLSSWLAEYHRLKPGDLAPYLYARPHDQAVRQAFRVACGLDSMVLGEPQVLGQMKVAARNAAAAGTLGPILHRLFQRSFSVAKEVRSTTGVGANSVSIAAAAVKLAARVFPSLKEQKVLLIGAGEMIHLFAKHFASYGPAALAVANRTVERGRALAYQFNGIAIELRELGEQLQEYDVIISCTASSLPILGKGLVERALRRRQNRPMFMVDLAVPRDIEQEVGELDHIFLYTLEDLSEVVSAGLHDRRSAVVQAEAIIETHLAQFAHWMQDRVNVPAIRAMREHAERTREREVARALRAIQRGEKPNEVLETLSHNMLNKLMHAPTQALRHGVLFPTLFSRSSTRRHS